MKRSILLPAAIFSWLIISLFLFPSCDIYPDGYNDYFGYTPDIAKPSGGSVSLLGGNVEMILPSGAVTSNITFSARECDNSKNCNFLLKMVRIEPKLVLEKPVTVKLKYNGSLSNANVQISECKPVICFWKSEEDYLNGVKQTCLCCCTDTAGATINFCMQQTGVFAVGDNSKSDFD
jgi:hypothetical protein